MSVKTLLDLSGRVALVTGGSRGLGLQIAEALGEMGAKVAITARKSEELDHAIGQLKDHNITAQSFVADIGKRETIAPLAEAVLKKFGKVDILVNNAGATWGAPAEDYPDEAWHKVMNLNVNAMFFLSRAYRRVPASVGGVQARFSRIGAFASTCRPCGVTVAIPRFPSSSRITSLPSA